MNNKIISIDTLKHYNNKISNYVDEKVSNNVEVKQDKINDLDEIRAGAAKGATALQSVPSEYVTETELSNKGYATISALNNKVDAINGKQLSTEDFTTALKNKLEALSNYDDTELSEAIETLRGDFDKIVSGDTTTAIKTFNEVIAFLDGLTDTQDLESIIASIEQQIAGKADNDSVVHIAGAETITGVKTFNGRVNFLGSGDSNAMYLSTNTRLNVDGTTNTVLGFSSGTFLINNAAYNLTLRGKGARPTYNSTTLALSSDIPAAVTESTVSGWGFTKNTGTYSKPSTGIPKSDLDSAVQTSLGKADTALQSYTEQYKGTITGVSANGTSVATSGVANIPAANTSAYGVTKLNSATNSTSTTEAATPSAVKAAYDLANSYKGTVTGVKINGTTKNPSNGVVDLGTVITAHQTLKTINGESIVGSGDITISGGSSGANVQAVDTGDVLDDVNVDYATTAYVDAKVANISLTDYATITYVDGLVGDINSILESIISGGGGNEITFYINDGGYTTPMKALSGMTWEEFVSSEYANQNSMLTNFSLFDMGTYQGVKFYHEEAMEDLTLYHYSNNNQNAKHTDIIEDGETYSAR